MKYWLVKTEPSTYSWHNLEKDKKTIWDGVRNFQARNNLKMMKKGDLAFFYHSGADKQIMGVAKVIKEYFPDPTDTKWVAVEIKIENQLCHPVTLSDVKYNKKLSDMTLVQSSRLSVQPVKKAEFDIIIIMSETS